MLTLSPDTIEKDFGTCEKDFGTCEKDFDTCEKDFGTCEEPVTLESDGNQCTSCKTPYPFSIESVNGTCTPFVKRSKEEGCVKCQFICTRCGYHSGRRWNVLKHIAIHTLSKNYSCEFCGRMFIERSNMKVHMRKHTGDYRFSCQQCGSGFIQKTALRRHLMVHAQLRPFRCSYCNKSFYTFQDLRNHENIHTKTHHTCTFCTSAFASISNLIRHKRIHREKGVRKYRCPIQACTQKLFLSSQSVRRHLKTHVDVFRCPQVDCKKLFSSMEDANRHLEIHIYPNFSTKLPRGRALAPELIDPATLSLRNSSKLPHDKKMFAAREAGVCCSLNVNSMSAWLFADVIRGVVTCILIAFGVTQVLSDEKNTAKFRFQMLSLIALVIMLFWFLGAHEPLYYGWEAYLVLASVVNVLLALGCLWLSYVITTVSYAALNLQSKLPKSMRVTYVLFSALTVIIQLVGLLLTLIMDELRYNSMRHFSNVLVVCFAGTYLETSLVKLWGEIQEMPSRHPSATGENRDRSRFVTRFESRFVTDESRFGVERSGNPVGIRAECPSPLSRTSRLSRTPTARRCSLPSTSSPRTPKASTAVPRTSSTDQEEKTAVLREAKEHRRRVSNSARNHKPSQSQYRTKMQKKNEIMKKVVRKVWHMIIIVPFIIFLTFVVLAYSGVSQLLEGGSYADSSKEYSDKYSLFEDISLWSNLVVAWFFQYYGVLKSPKYIQRPLNLLISYFCCSQLPVPSANPNLK
ncbi:hypothetical protein AAMO2058_000228600 [Amorphochlora amoebiformis]